MTKILVVEDNADLAYGLKNNFEIEGYAVEVVEDGATGLLRARSGEPDLIVLDLMLPELDGYRVLRGLRGEGVNVPVLILTARGEEADKVLGFRLGADDYVTKPFSPKELVARVGALLRRVERAKQVQLRQQFGPISIDADRHVVTVEGEEVRLTAKEFLLLEYLVRHRGRVLSRDLLLSDVWGYQYTGGTRTVDVHVSRLREKIPYLAGALETVKQFGYKLIEP